MTMKDWIDALDNMIISHQRQILVGSGTVSREEAFEKAEREYELYRQIEMRNYKSLYDELWEKVNSRDSKDDVRERHKRCDVVGNQGDDRCQHPLTSDGY